MTADSPPRSAFRMQSPRLVARCWSPDDAEAFRALIDDSDAHLRPFIPWMRSEPATLAATRERLALYRDRFVAALDFRYALLDARERLVGELMLSTRSGPGTREVGYLLSRRVVGAGLGSEACAMAVRVAFEIGGVGRVELHCVPENAASVRIATKLGFSLAERRPGAAEDSDGVQRDLLVWWLEAEQFPSSPAAALPVAAYDRRGRPLPGSG
jgi:RimJ/RimL family protein N-acetyltransferase